MRISSTSISRSIRKNLREMAMDLPPNNTPHPDITSKLAQGDTAYKNVPLPDGTQPNQNFQELLASERYKQVIQRMQNYTNRQISLNGEQGVMPLIGLVKNSLMHIIRTEAQFRPQLEELAVELVKKEMGIPEGSFQFDAKIVGIGEMDMQGMNKGNQQQEPEQEEQNVEVEQDLANRLANLDLEKAKRRLINSMIQGSSMQGYFMYHFVAEKIGQITGSEELVKNYGIMMSVNDSLYWQFSDEMMGAAQDGEMMAGKEEVDRNTEPPTIIARGMCFPALVHELIKGVMEIFAVQGQPENGFDEVSASEDTLEKEAWDVRLGPAIWDRIRAQFPEDIIVDENKRELQSYLLVSIFKLEAKQFLVFMKEVLSGSEEGKEMMNELMEGIRKALNQEAYDQEIEALQTDVNDIAEQTPNEELNDFLKTLRIGGFNPN